MKHCLTIAISLALIAMTGVAAASPYQDNHRDPNRSGWNDRDHGGKDHRDQRHYDRRDNRPPPRHDNGRRYGPGPGPRYYRGQHLPPRYMGSPYYVQDYRHYRLHDPRPGHRWVRSDNGQFLLVAIATGVIVEALVNP